MLSSDLRLGASVDGQPDATASGDGADEDGVTLGPLAAGGTASVTVNANVPGGAALLNAWIDFNRDGDWGDPGEQVFVDQALSNGTNNLNVSVPAGATAGSTFARFRVTSCPGYSFFGLAPNGEVEDYQVTIVAALSGVSSQQLVSAGWFAGTRPQPLLSGLSSGQQTTSLGASPTWSSVDTEVCISKVNRQTQRTNPARG